MSWMTKLHETYENCQSEIGKKVSDGEKPLIPFAFSIQDAHVEVTISLRGDFLSAKSLDKTDKLTMIPCTEDSANRAGAAAFPHPLFDKLQYTAGDYTEYGGGKGDKFYEVFIQQLGNWCVSSYQNPKVEAIYQYLKKGSLIHDLIDAKVLWSDGSGKLMKKWTGDKNEVPSIFKVIAGEQADAFVRFSVIGDGVETKVWLDKEMRESWQQYYLSTQQNRQLCYVTGKEVACAEKHASKIRNTADMAKLISGNDYSGFTFRGRFSEKSEAACVGYDVSQKAHNALRWLISRQGYHSGDQVILAWETKNQKIPQPISDVQEFLEDEQESEEAPIFTQQEYAFRLNKAVAGYKQNLDSAAQVAVIELDSATPGRLSIPYYRELCAADYLDRIKSWYESCCWWFTYSTKDKKSYFTSVSTPPPREIVAASYGANVSTNLKKATIKRLLPCIIDQANIPSNLVNSTVRRASNPVSMEKWEWNKALSIACALYKKQYEEIHEKECLQMALENDKTDRSYLYGRLLAIADKIEGMTYTAGDNRQTNAMRYMNMFSQHPFRTWQIISERLIPYETKLGGRCKKYIDLMTEVHNLFLSQQFETSDSLDGLYLLGFFCQRQVFLDEQKAAKEKLEQQKMNVTEEE